MQLFKKQIAFSEFSATFFKFKWNFENFQKKAGPLSRCISEVMDSEKRCKINV